MDIPGTGAVFTLGKSHLADNAQSYFYIKNDPIKRVVSGANQSAVICESGRLFVWGENQYGQLGIGTTNDDIVSRPTCVKSIKSIGLKVAFITFGMGWSAILTDSNEVFFTGKNIFPLEAKCSHNFTRGHLGEEEVFISWKPFRLDNFDGLLVATGADEDEHFVGIFGGYQHFILPTSHGRAFAWGNNSNNQLGMLDTNLVEPVEIQLKSKITQITCGPSSTLLLTENNELFITGQLNEFHYDTFTELDLVNSNEHIQFMHISHSNEIFIITDDGNIYRSSESKRYENLIFQKFYDYTSEEYGPVRKLLKGPSFFAALTQSKKFYTTFSESGHHLKTFREISKFKNLRTLEMTVGDQHILVLGVPKNGQAMMNKTYIMNSDMNGNLGRMSLPKLTEKISEEEDMDVGNRNDDFENENLKPNTPVESLGHVERRGDTHEDSVDTHVEEQMETNVAELETNKIENKETEQINSEPEVQTITNDTHTTQIEDALLKPNEIAQSPHSSPSCTPKEEMVKTPKSLILPYIPIELDSTTPNKSSSPNVSIKSGQSSIKSIKFDDDESSSPKSFKLVRPRTPFPDSISSIVSTPQTVKRLPKGMEDGSPAFSDSLENISEINNVSRRTSLKYSDRGLPKEHLEDITRKLSNESIPNNLQTKYIDIDLDDAEDEELRIEIESSDLSTNEIRFINNGVDVTENVPIENDELEEPISTRVEPGLSSNDATEDVSESREAEKTSDFREEDERTTASINSAVTSPNVFDNDNEIDSEPSELKVPLGTAVRVEEDILNGSEIHTERSKVKRFLDDIKTKRNAIGCRSEKAIRVEDEPPKYTPIDQHLESQNNTSKVCTIL